MKNDKIPKDTSKVNFSEITIRDKDTLGAYLKAKAQSTDQGGTGKAVTPEAQKKSFSGSVSRFASKKLKGEVVSPPAKPKKG